MKYLGRKRDCIKSAVILVPCIIALCSISWLCSYLGKETLDMQELEPEEIIRIQNDENVMGYDKEALSAYAFLDIERQEDVRAFINNLPGNKSFTDITYKISTEPYGVYLTYDEINLLAGWTKENKRTLIFNNSVLLLNACPSLDFVKITLRYGESEEAGIVYRKDLGEYLTANSDVNLNYPISQNIDSLFKSDLQEGYFAKQEKQCTALGEEAEEFFNTHFPQNYEEKINPDFIYDEDLGNDLLSTYGEDLYREGLKKDNLYLNIFSAYRLMEYYDSSHKEDLILDLIICKQSTSYDEVKAACEEAISFLSYEGSKPYLVTRFKENSYGGGQKILGIINHQYCEFFAWKDSVVKGGISQIEISPYEDYVFVKVTGAKTYNYMLPLNTANYKVTSTLVIDDKGQTYSEMGSVLSKRNGESAEEDILDLQVEWLNKNVVKFMLSSVDDKVLEYIYKLDTLQIVEQKEMLYDLKYFMAETNVILQDALEDGTNVKVLKLAGEVLYAYECRSYEEREKLDSQLTKQVFFNKFRLQENGGGYKVYEFGKLIVIYNGNKQSVVTLLRSKLGEMKHKF